VVWGGGARLGKGWHPAAAPVPFLTPRTHPPTHSPPLPSAVRHTSARPSRRQGPPGRRPLPEELRPPRHAAEFRPDPDDAAAARALLPCTAPGGRGDGRHVRGPHTGYCAVDMDAALPPALACP